MGTRPKRLTQWHISVIMSGMFSQVLAKILKEREGLILPDKLFGIVDEMIEALRSKGGSDRHFAKYGLKRIYETIQSTAGDRYARVFAKRYGLKTSSRRQHRAKGKGGSG